MSKGGREIISTDEAIERVLESVPSPTGETVTITEADGRILTESVVCADTVPAADNSAMDGFGVRRADLDSGRSLQLVGDSRAGSPFSGELTPGQCARVMTGGLIPCGVDTVVPVELTSGYEPGPDGMIEFHDLPAAGANIRREGSVCAPGDVLIESGARITPAEIGVLAQQGRTHVAVGRRPRVAVLPTGDEVVAIDRAPGPGQVRNSNAWATLAQVRQAGGDGEMLPILRDREGDTAARLAAALDAFDLVCTIGGVSMGTHDLVRGAFAELSGETIVESIRIKPGKPTLFGAVARSRGRSFLLGLPGNPASSFTIFALLGAPFVRAFQGVSRERALVRRTATLRGNGTRKNWRLQALPARTIESRDGVFVEQVEQRTSADLFSLVAADALYFAPAEHAPVDGDVVEWVRLR